MRRTPDDPGGQAVAAAFASPESVDGGQLPGRDNSPRA
jgi:hypothetical protein